MSSRDNSRPARSRLVLRVSSAEASGSRRPRMATGSLERSPGGTPITSPELGWPTPRPARCECAACKPPIFLEPDFESDNE